MTNNITPHLEKGVDEMCNLSEDVEKRGINKEKFNTALRMIERKKYSPEEIAEISGLLLKEVMELMNGKSA